MDLCSVTEILTYTPEIASTLHRIGDIFFHHGCVNLQDDLLVLYTGPLDI